MTVGMRASSCNMSMRFFFLLLLSLGSLSTRAQTPPDGAACWDSTTEILLDLLNMGYMPEEQKVYKLCPRTTYTIGSQGLDGQCCFGGEFSLVAAQPNILYQCGDNGNVEDNCVLTGGDIQFIDTPTVNFGASDNIKVVGLTFQDSVNRTLVLDNAGDVTFTNCLFRVSYRR